MYSWARLASFGKDHYLDHPRISITVVDPGHFTQTFVVRSTEPLSKLFDLYRECLCGKCGKPVDLLGPPDGIYFKRRGEVLPGEKSFDELRIRDGGEVLVYAPFHERGGCEMKEGEEGLRRLHYVKGRMEDGVRREGDVTEAAAMD